MELKANEIRDKLKYFPSSKCLPKKTVLPQSEENSLNQSTSSSSHQQNQMDYLRPSRFDEKRWTDFENCLKDIDKNYENSEYMSKIRNSVVHVESLKELVKVHAEISGIREEYDIQTRQEEIVYLFKSGKNGWEFIKIFDRLLEVCGTYISNAKNNGSLKETESENEDKIIKDKKNEAKLQQESEDFKAGIKKEIEKIDEGLINRIISNKVSEAIGRVEERFLSVDLKAMEMDKQIFSIKKTLKKMKNAIDKKWYELKLVESHIEQQQALLTLPVKRRRFSVVESVKSFRSKGNLLSPSEEPEANSEESFAASSLTLRDNHLDNMIYKLRLRGGVKMTDIWRLNNCAVIFNLNELKSIVDVAKIDELARLRPWATRWKAKDKYFFNMKNVSSPFFNRNISKYDNSLKGITASLTENYLVHFDLYCTWRKLKLWLKDISNTIDLCITPSYPHKIRSIIVNEYETGFGDMLEKALPYLTKQRLDRTPNLVLYSFIDDFPDDYLIKSHFCIIGRNQSIDLRKILNLTSYSSTLKLGQ